MTKRSTDAPRPDPRTPAEESAANDTSVTMRLRALPHRDEPATPVEAAAALIELCVHESNGPVEDLSNALGRIAKSFQQPGDLEQRRAQLAQDLAVCVESMQFHDRFTQQLTQVRNLLATLAASDSYADLGKHPLQIDPNNWLVLVENLRSRFTSDSHRILFNLLLPGAGSRNHVASLHANEGSVELF